MRVCLPFFQREALGKCCVVLYATLQDYRGEPVASHPLCRHLVYCAAWPSRSVHESKAHLSWCTRGVTTKTMSTMFFNPKSSVFVPISCQIPGVPVFACVIQQCENMLHESVVAC